MSAEVDHYAVLGLERNATPDDIRAAYRREARASHPDLHPDDEAAPERFKRVQLAYEALSDPVRRADYDAPQADARESLRPIHRQTAHDEPVSLARELGETVRAIRVVARRSGFGRRMSRLLRYLERL